MPRRTGEVATWRSRKGKKETKLLIIRDLLRVESKVRVKILEDLIGILRCSIKWKVQDSRQADGLSSQYLSEFVARLRLSVV